MNEDQIKAARILVVDDEPANVLLLERILKQAGYTAVFSTTDSRQVASLCQQTPPDIVLLDLMMPYLDGFGVLREFGPLLQQTYLPIVVLTADISPEAKRRALSSGARDFLTKPLDYLEVLLRVHNLLETRLLTLELCDQNEQLETRVRRRTRQLQEANGELQSANIELHQSKQQVENSQIEILQRLAQAAEFRDDDTGQHTQRVGQIATMLARALELDDEQVSLIGRSASLHDVGKIGISDLILLKPGKLTSEEFATMKTHTSIGASLLAKGHSPLVQTAQRIALTHHEHWDGNGYPCGLRDAEIPIEGRIVAIADVFDALTHERPYKKAWPIDQAIREIAALSGQQFDPRVVQAFLQLPLHDYV